MRKTTNCIYRRKDTEEEMFKQFLKKKNYMNICLKKTLIIVL